MSDFSLPTPDDAGVWIDELHGRYAPAHVIRLAVNYGWDDVGAADLATRCLNGEYVDFLYEAAEDAEDWLNRNVTPEGYLFGWHEGNFVLWSEAMWEDVDAGLYE